MVYLHVYNKVTCLWCHQRKCLPIFYQSHSRGFNVLLKVPFSSIRVLPPRNVCARHCICITEEGCSPVWLYHLSATSGADVMLILRQSRLHSVHFNCFHIPLLCDSCQCGAAVCGFELCDDRREYVRDRLQICKPVTWPLPFCSLPGLAGCKETGLCFCPVLSTFLSTGRVFGVAEGAVDPGPGTQKDSSLRQQALPVESAVLPNWRLRQLSLTLCWCAETGQPAPLCRMGGPHSPSKLFF